MNNNNRPNGTIAAAEAAAASPSRFGEGQHEEDHCISSPHNNFSSSKDNSKNTPKISSPPPPPMSPPLSPSYSPSQRLRNSRRFNRHSSPLSSSSSSPLSPSSRLKNKSKIKGGVNGNGGGGMLLSTFFDRQQDDGGVRNGGKGDDMFSIAGETMLTEDLEKKGLCRVIEIHDTHPTSTASATTSATTSPCPSPRSGRPRLRSNTTNRPTMEDKRQLSFLSLSDESYIMDLATQKDQRAEERHQEALEEALDRVNAYVKTIEPKHLRPTKDSEEYAALFLKILAKTKDDIEAKYKEYDEMIDDKLEEAVHVELTRRKKQQSQQVTTTSISNSLHSSSHSHSYLDSSHQSTTLYGLDDISEGGQYSNSSTSSSSASSSSAAFEDINNHDDDESNQIHSSSDSSNDSITQKDSTDIVTASRTDSTKTSSLDGHTDPTHYTTMSDMTTTNPTATTNYTSLVVDKGENVEEAQAIDTEEKTEDEKETALPQVDDQKDDDNHDLVFDEISVHDEEELTVDSDDALVLEVDVDEDEDEEVIEEEIIEGEEFVVEEETIDDDNDDDFIEFSEDEIEFVGDVIDISLKVLPTEPDTKNVVDTVKADTKTDTKRDIKTPSSDLAFLSPRAKEIPAVVFSPRATAISSGRENTLIADVANCKNYRNLQSPGLNVLRSPPTRSPSSKLADRIKLFDSPPKETLDVLSPTPTKLRRARHGIPSSVKAEDPVIPSLSSEAFAAGETIKEEPKDVPTDSIKNPPALLDTNTFISPVQKKASPAVLYDASTLSKKLAKVKKMIKECTDSKEVEKLQKKQQSYEDDLAALKKPTRPNFFEKGTSKSLSPEHSDPPSSSPEKPKQSKMFVSPVAVTALENSPVEEAISPVLTNSPLRNNTLSPRMDSSEESTTNKKPDENKACQRTAEDQDKPSNTKFTLADFEQGRVHDADMSEWESYLTSIEFEKHFGMSIDDFSKQPKWKRERLKRKVRKNF
mmetsp:Transcript_53170/g.129107  ORF Transcript_53170/g.129107 Transcript_53170/m.129107 type:complete len:978 (-) Transcript_53170:28-2961(-)